MNGKNGDIYVQKSPAATIEVLIDALKKVISPIISFNYRHKTAKSFGTLCSRGNVCS